MVGLTFSNEEQDHLQSYSLGTVRQPGLYWLVLNEVPRV
jgi:hypothetical protein